jgi:hypothetical protein
MKKVMFGLFSLSMLVTACKKEDNDCPKTQAELAGTYKLSLVELVSGTTAVPITDDYLEACEKDDELILNANGTFNFLDAGIACDPTSSETGTWQVNSNGTFTINDEILTLEDAVIAKFDCKNLVLETTETVMGVSATIRVTLSKK